MFCDSFGKSYGSLAEVIRKSYEGPAKVLRMSCGVLRKSYELYKSLETLYMAFVYGLVCLTKCI